MANLIEVEHLVKRYKKSDTNAVDDVSFNVAQGELFAFLGPNGAGKTTTISILTTILSKTSGHVKIAGYDINKQQKEIRRQIGIIFQNPSIDLNLSAEENLRFHAVLYGQFPFRPAFALMPSEYKDRVHDLAKLIGIEKDLMKPVRTFSGGMKRKLEIIRSLMHTPKILFLDEPTTGLDPLSRRNLWEYLLTVREQQGTTIFLTTHYLEEAEGADRVCVINHGKVVALGTPTKIKNDLIDKFILVEAADLEKLQKELKQKKVEFTKKRNQLKVDINGHNVHQLIKSIDTPLTNIVIHNPTLEDAYLHIINEPNAGS